MSIHSVSLKGKRNTNEDKHTIFVNLDNNDKTKAPINLYGVYDGHGSKFVSKFLSEKLAPCLTDIRVQYPLKKSFVEKLYDYWQTILKTNFKQQADISGSTCLIVAHYKSGGDFLNILNTGDSRCILCRNNMAFVLTKDHKPHWFEENFRIKALGGQPIFDGCDWRINDLSVSRAFGDVSAEPYVTCMPEIFRYKLSSDDKFIVLGCDGLWDVMSNQEVINFILDNCYDAQSNTRINKHINVAKRLAQFAITKGSTDNITILVIFLN